VGLISGGESHPHATRHRNVRKNNKYDKFIEVLDWYKSGRRQGGGTSPIVGIAEGFISPHLLRSLFTNEYYPYTVN
jgi:hypothetical protein